MGFDWRWDILNPLRDLAADVKDTVGPGMRPWDFRDIGRWGDVEPTDDDDRR